MEATVKERIRVFINYKKISARAFESQCGFSNGYLRQLKNSPTVDKMEMILSAFPEINREWLTVGNGEMLKDNATQISHGDNSPNISGNGNNVNAASTIEKALNEIAEQRKLVSKAQDQVSVAQSQVTAAMEQVSKSQQQIDRLLSILETTNNV